MRNLDTEVRFLPKNEIHVGQPADIFIISMVKPPGRHHGMRNELKWLQMSSGLISKGGYGKLPNPGKMFFSQLEVQDVREVNQQR